MDEAKPPVVPILHPLDVVDAALLRGDVWSDEVRETMAWLGKNDKWAWFYSISARARLEVSMLIDAEGLCFVDWGTISRVGLNPPAGATIPFQVWTHTHPSGDSYWSYTDRETLAIASAARIIQKAIVLGRGQIKEANWSKTPLLDGLSEKGPLANWSNETVEYIALGKSPWEMEVEV